MTSTWTRRLGAAAVVSLCPLALAACGGEDEAESKPSGATVSPRHDSTIPEIVDPGEGDRQELVLDLTEGDRSTTTFDVVMKLNGDQGTVTIPIKVTTTMEVDEVGDVFSDVSTTITDVTVDGSDLDPANAQQFQEGLSPAEGFVLATKVAPSGAPLRSGYSRTDPAVTNAVSYLSSVPGFPLAQASVVFPTEPVGVGAVWRRTFAQDKNQDGETADVVTTYTLEELDGSNYRVSYEMTGGDGSVEEDEFVSSGVLEGTLRSIAPTSLTGEATSTTDTEIDGNNLHLVTTTEFEVTSR